MVGDNARTDGGACEAGIAVYLLPPHHDRAVRGLSRVMHLVRGP
jgi:FMN phosphatase YigB (HAD superfamily)